MVTERFANKHKLTITPTDDPAITKLLSSNTGGTDIGTTEFLIKNSGLSLPISARAARVLSIDFLVCVDFLQAYEAKIDYHTGLISLSDDLVRASLLSDSKPDNFATCVESVCIPPETEMVLPVSVPARFNGKTVLLEPIPRYQFRLAATAHSFGHCVNGRTVCRVFNFRPHAVVLRRRMQLAVVEPMSNVVSCTSMAGNENSQEEGPRTPLYSQDRSTLDNIAQDYGFNINPELTEYQKSELLQLLFDYKSSFARDLSEMKAYPYYQHKIQLMGSRKIYKRNYSFTPEDAKMSQEQFDNMFHHGIIEKSTGMHLTRPVSWLANVTARRG